MTRVELVQEIIIAVNATTPEQITKVNKCMNDAVLAVQVNSREEFLISNLKDTELAIVKKECIKRYRL